MIAVKGNFQQVRTLFVNWRSLIVAKKISWQGLTQDDIDFINQVKGLPEWTPSQAFNMLNIIRRFKGDLALFNVFVDQDQVKVPAEQSAASAPPQQPTRKLVTYDGERLVIQFPYRGELVRAVKAEVPGRRYHSDKKVWTAPLDHGKEVLAFARAYGFMIGDRARQMVHSFQMNYELSYSFKRVELELPLNHRLYDYQTVGVDYGIRAKKYINADSMGLGKTIQAVGVAIGVNKYPVAVICPKSLRHNWKREVEQWTNKKAVVLTHKNIKQLNRFIEYGMADFVILNYEGVKSFFVEEIRESEYQPKPRPGAPRYYKKPGKKKRKRVIMNGLEKLFKQVIIDEAHECRNVRTTRFKTINAFAKNIRYRQLLTGTPIVNSAKDLAALLTLVDRIDDFGGFSRFAKNYAELGKGSLNEMSGRMGARKIADLNTKLRTNCMVRREKHMVLKELPDKTRTVIRLELDNRKEYDQAYMSLYSYLMAKNFSSEKISSAMNAEMLTRMLYLSKISTRGKMAAFLEWVHGILDQGEKLIVFVWFRETIELIKAEFPNALEISGNTSDDDVEANKEQFQNDPDCDLIVVTYKRGGVGHTLTAASNVAFPELGWTPKDQEQAEDRSHRIGQKNSVVCYYFLGENTIDEYKYEIIDRKRAISATAIDSRDNVSIQHELLETIIKKNEKQSKENRKTEAAPAGAELSEHPPGPYAGRKSGAGKNKRANFRHKN